MARIDLTGGKKVRTGDLVRIVCRLSPGMVNARLSVWAAVGDYKPSPYVPAPVAEAIQTGEPTMAQPMYARLRQDKRKHVFEFTAEEDMTVHIYQEVDTLNDARVKARIWKHGRPYQAFRRMVRNFGRSLRR